MTLAVSLALLEFAVRLAMPQQLIFYRPDIYTEDERTGWRFASDLDTRVNTGERDVRLVTDARGRRVGADPLPISKRRVLAVGDSFIAGLQVQHADLVTSQLAAALTRDLGKPVSVVAAASPGWGPQQYAEVVERELAEGDYIAVLVFLFMGNDVVSRLDKNFSPDQIYRRLDRGFGWPRGVSLRAIADAWLVPLDDLLDVRSHLYVLVRQRLMNLRIRLGLAPVFLPPTLLRSAAEGPGWDVTARLGARIANAAAQRGVPLRFVLLPANYQVDSELFARHLELMELDAENVDLDQPSRLLGESFAARGLIVVDVTADLRRAHAEGGVLYGRVDHHLEPDGHRVLAERLVPELRAFLIDP